MEIVAWLGWAIVAVLGVLWSLLWFLISGWVSTLLQIMLLIATIYYFKYGWQQAPIEVWRHTRSFSHFFWSCLRARELQAGRDVQVREVVRVVRTKEFGDISISTLLSLLVLIGLTLLTKV
jgi:hypothetical protein